MKVLITGGAGFIGIHLTRNLIEKGHDVVIVDNFSRGVKDSILESIITTDNVRLEQADLLDKESINGLGNDFDIIFHLAAIIGVQNVMSYPYKVLTNNVELLINLIDFANMQKKLKRFVFASTSEVYAGTLKYYGLDIPTKEDTPLTINELEHPRTSYMLSKIYGEALLHQSDLPYTIVRPHNFYGPRMGMSHVIPELLRKAFFNENDGKLEVFSPAHKRTFCYIDDAVEMMARLAFSEEAIGETFNIGSEAPEYTMRSVGEIVLEVENKEYQIKEMPPSPGSPERRCPSMAKTSKITGYTPVVELKEGIQKTYEWYKRHVFEGNEISAK